MLSTACDFVMEHWNNYSSMSSLSASMDSLSNGSSNFSSSVRERELARVEDGEASPMIGLKLGKRTYFEDVSGGGNVQPSRSSSSVASRNPRAPYLSSKSTPRCQVEGCNFDLSSGKDYHRRHRVCESHTKSPMVVVAGLERRFCQQCSRFHGLLEFDEEKRSCRRRLSDHNARRRKPRPDATQYNFKRISSSINDAGQQTSLAHTWPAAKLTLETKVEVFSQGLEETYDYLKALYHLSNYPWRSGSTGLHSFNHQMNANYAHMVDSTVRALPQGRPEYWQTENQPDGSQVQHALAGGNQFQEFQLFKAPSDQSGFYSDHIN